MSRSKIIPLIPRKPFVKQGSVLEAAVARGGVTREEALIVWDQVIALDPHFFDDYPRDYSGQITDDERAEIIQEAAPMLLRARK